MKELVEVIAKALVDDPDSVAVSERQDGRTTVMKYVSLTVHGKSDRKTGAHCKSDPFCCKSSSGKGR